MASASSLPFRLLCGKARPDRWSRGPRAPLALCCLCRAAVSLLFSVKLCICALLCRDPLEFLLFLQWVHSVSFIPNPGSSEKGAWPSVLQLCLGRGTPSPVLALPPPFQPSPALLPIPKEEQRVTLLHRVSATSRALQLYRTHWQFFTDLIFFLSLLL